MNFPSVCLTPSKNASHNGITGKVKNTFTQKPLIAPQYSILHAAHVATELSADVKSNVKKHLYL